MTLWPVGTDAAALPAVARPGHGTDGTARRRGDSAGPGAPAAGALVGARRAAHGADAVAAAGVCAARACGGGALRHGCGTLAQHVARAARRQPRAGCARPACGAHSVCIQCVCGLRGPAVVLSRAVRHRLPAGLPFPFSGEEPALGGFSGADRPMGGGGCPFLPRSGAGLRPHSKRGAHI